MKLGATRIEGEVSDWGELINANFAALDIHNHVPGSGAQIPTAGLNINADLAFSSFNTSSGIRSTRYAPIALGSLVAQDLGCLVVSGVDLYYVDGAGAQIRVTSAGALAGTPGIISGLVAPGLWSPRGGPAEHGWTLWAGIAAKVLLIAVPTVHHA